MDEGNRRRDNRVPRASGSTTVRNLNYVHAPEIPHHSHQPRRRISVSTIRPLNYVHRPEASSRSRRHSSTSARPLDYTTVPKPPPRAFPSSTARNLNYIIAPEHSARPPSPTRKTSFSARPLDYLHTPHHTPHLPTRRRHSTSSKFLSFALTPEAPLPLPARETPSSAARTLNYTTRDTDDYVRRDLKLFTKTPTLGNLKHPPHSAAGGKWPPSPSPSSSSSKARPLNYTQVLKLPQSERTRRAISFPKARPIDYRTAPPPHPAAASPPAGRAMSAVSKVRALDFTQSANSASVENVRSRSSFSNIAIMPGEQELHRHPHHEE